MKNIRNGLNWAQIGALELGIMPIGQNNQINLVVISDWARNSVLGLKMSKKKIKISKMFGNVRQMFAIYR